MTVDPVAVGEAVAPIIAAGIIAGVSASRAVRGKLRELVAEVMRGERPKLLKGLRRELRPVVRAVVREEMEGYATRLGRLEGAFYERHGHTAPPAEEARTAEAPSPSTQHQEKPDGQ